MIIYIDNRIQQKKLEVKNNSESTLNYISIFNKLIATLLLDLVYFEILYIYIYKPMFIYMQCILHYPLDSMIYDPDNNVLYGF